MDGFLFPGLECSMSEDSQAAFLEAAAPPDKKEAHPDEEEDDSHEMKCFHDIKLLSLSYALKLICPRKSRVNKAEDKVYLKIKISIFPYSCAQVFDCWKREISFERK